MKRVALGIGIAIVVLTGGGLAALFMMADVAATRYENKVYQTARALDKQLAALGDSTYRGVMEDPDQAPTKSQNDITQITNMIAETRRELQALSAASARIDQGPVPFVQDASLSYRHALALQDKTQATVRQIDESLTNYTTLIAFLQGFLQAKATFQAELAVFNGVHDFNDFAGRGDVFHAGAARLREAAQTLGQVPTPSGMTGLSKHMIGLLTQAAGEFDDLGGGFDVAIDSTIYDAVHRIEATTAEFESQGSKVYDPALNNSRILKDVRDLIEKIDPISNAPQ